MEKHNIDDIVKKTETYIDDLGEGGFVENDYTLDDIPYLFGKLVLADILPEGPYIQITSEGADVFSLNKSKFLVFDESDNFVTYLREKDVLGETESGYENLTEEGFRLLAEAYLKAV